MIKALELNIILMEVEPYIWRKILVKDDISFETFHAILQTIMGWEDRHLYEFETFREGYENISRLYEGDKNDAAKVQLKDVFNYENVIGYIYDTGKDSWAHRIEREHFLAINDQTSYPICLAGERACPPENIGGAEKYVKLLDAWLDTSHKKHKKSKELLGENFDPATFDLKKINKKLKNFQ